jgi:tRNA-dihydrouridine synthase 1
MNSTTSAINTLSSQSYKEKGYTFYKKMGSPKFIVAPMVDQSELPYRMLTRKYNAQLCYTPMIHSRMFIESETYRK